MRSRHKGQRSNDVPFSIVVDLDINKYSTISMSHRLRVSSGRCAPFAEIVYFGYKFVKNTVFSGWAGIALRDRACMGCNIGCLGLNLELRLLSFLVFFFFSLNSTAVRIAN